MPTLLSVLLSDHVQLWQQLLCDVKGSGSSVDDVWAIARPSRPFSGCNLGSVGAGAALVRSHSLRRCAHAASALAVAPLTLHTMSWPASNDSLSSVAAWCNRDLYGLVGVNVLVWLLWQSSQVLCTCMRRCMRAHFTSSLRNLKHGRVWTIFTASFSHEDAAHMLHNMFWLLSVGPTLQAIVGRSRLVELYVVGGLAGSISSVLWHRGEAEGVGARCVIRCAAGPLAVQSTPSFHYLTFIFLGDRKAELDLPCACTVVHYFA